MKIEISIGELVDKVTILQIKLNRIEDPEKKKHIQQEFDALSRQMQDAGIPFDSDEYIRLKRLNETLWDIENSIRAKEASQEFDDAFIQLARQVYLNNDARSQLKRALNLRFHSEWIEEKEYAEYPSRK
jgi:hypothetical protein